MRLINLDTLDLEEYYGQDVPDYAILSHTWEEEEVTFADWNAPAHSAHLVGFNKVGAFVNRARRYAVQYGWVDTCCIDKSSSAELSEAINSMFGYYKKAAVCIIYLSDVWNHSGTTCPDELFKEMSGARWFTRGWTLQELIAPSRSRVQFYDSSWQYLSPLAGKLLVNIAEKTGIPTRVLSSEDQPSEWSIAQRMCWASGRNTTRVEDEAYSLLGIFDVSLPLIYGEGRRAYMRLQEEIIQRSVDHSIFAWDKRFAVRSWISDMELFAATPADFAETTVEQCYQHDSNWVESFEMTNQGLRLSLPLVPCGFRDGIYHGILNCRPQGQEKGPVALNLVAAYT